MKKEFCRTVSVLAFVLAGMTASGNIPFVRTVSEANEPVERERASAKAFIFAERQPYTPVLNYQHKYIDRPLFTDTSLRRGKGGYAKRAFRRDIDVLLWSGFDGFGSIAYPQWYIEQMKSYESDPPPPGYSQFLILSEGFHRSPTGRDDPVYKSYKQRILIACASRYTTRLNGMPLVWLWGNGADKQREWLKALKADPEIPPFLCFPIVPFLPMYGEFNNPAHPGVCPPEACERYKRELAEMLSWADGVQMRLHESYASWDGDHGRHILKTDLCRKYLFPLTLEVMERPEFKGKKYLAAQIEQAYINHFNGPVTGQYGTETLRTFLDEAMLQNPDFLVGFEWNECNENTSFQPTVSGAGAVARVIGYYKSKLNREPLKPRPGDDTSLPNLILSTRKAMRVGENYHIEFLYVPDGVPVEPFKARVVLYSASGARLAQLPWENLPTARLTAFDYRLPSERFDKELAVYPEVEVERAGKRVTYRGFNCTRFDPTTAVNYLYTRQPLRELIVPEKAEFEVVASGKGRYTMKGSFACAEELASLEVVEDLREALSVDRERTFDRSRYRMFRVSVLPMRDMGSAEGTVEVTGTGDWELRKSYLPYDDVQRVLDKGNPRRIKINLCTRRIFFLSVPKAAVDTARFRMNVEKLGAAPEIDLSAVMKHGIRAVTWPKQVRLEVERMEYLPDYPVPLDAGSASFEETLETGSACPVYHMRAITKSGRLWRSKPVLPVKPPPASRRIESFSEFERKTVAIEPQAARIVDFKYDFGDDSRGDVLRSRDASTRWDVLMGGGWESYGPMNWAWIKPKLTADFAGTVPVRTTCDGAAALSFDGKGQYLALPQEWIPCDSGFTLAFEIRPDDAESRVLIRQSHSVRTECGLRLVTDRGELVLSFYGREIVPRHFRTGLRLKVGEWNRVKVEKTANTLSCSLDGVSKTFPYDRRGRLFQTAIFGANVMPGDKLPEGIKPYKGLMRALEIRHGAEAPPEPLKVTLTFDDNLRDHLLIAAPELEKRGWRGLFAIVTDWVDGADKYRLTWDDIRELKRRGHIIANHSKSHDLKRGGLGGLAKLGLLDTVRSEIALASDVMEKELGERPRYLCLPGTSYTEEVGKIAAELGIKPMLVHRECFGAGREDVYGCIRMTRANKRDKVDFLVHGVCLEGKGWMAFKTKDDFIKYLDKVKAAEDAGLIKVVDYDSL